MDERELIVQMNDAYERNFTGWDFDLINSKTDESEDPWDYRQIVETALQTKTSVLDMGTGGGEFLFSLKNLPSRVCATEGYEKNLPVAKKRLKKKGIEVKFISANKIPYECGQFDIIINRHESFDAQEVHRVLKRKGVFITQQVGGMNDSNLNFDLNAKAGVYLTWNLFKAAEGLEKAGFKIERKANSIGYTRFYDIMTLVYYLKCIPWQIEDFSIDTHRDRLISIHDYISENGYYDLIRHRFLLVCSKKS
ncbi:MAG: class I SAM-dependent methyltransferase [Sphaerochaetaceae bacterium]|nr:class I SAM-dependent methyltransferase [Sphaerochaetaceae bacterium]